MKYDEKTCPMCAEVIKKAALVCKHCGHKFTAQQVAASTKATDPTSAALGCGCLIVIAIVVLFLFSMCTNGGSKSSSSTSTSSSPKAPSEDEKIAFFQVEAKKAMTDSLKDPGSAKYQDVQAYALGAGYVFCGRVNSKNGFGGYTGFQRFVAGPGMVGTEQTVSDFPVLWQQACTGVGHSIWW